MEHRVPKREEIFRMIEGGKSHSATDASARPEGADHTAREKGVQSEEKTYTVKDIEALPEGVRAELIDGKMYMMAAPTLTHQDILMWLSVKIWNYIKEHGGPCKVLPAPFAVYIKDDEHNYVEPDISVICDMDKLDEKGCHGAPDWVVEIVSPSSKVMDCIRKCPLYEKAGVREYWVIDPREKSVMVYNFEHDFSEQYAFSEQVKAGIYADLFLDFNEVA